MGAEPGLSDAAYRSRRGMSWPPACPTRPTIGPRMTGRTCAGLWVTGTGKDGESREVYLYHVVDNEWSMREYGAKCVVWQTAVNPVVALGLLATGVWQGAGVRGPESFDATPFLELLKGAPAGWLRLGVGDGGPMSPRSRFTRTMGW